MDAKHIKAAIRDIFKDPVVINGKPYDHLTEVNNRLKGLTNQIKKVEAGINKGSFTDDVLVQAKRLRSTLQKEKDRLTTILNKAKNAANQ